MAHEMTFARALVKPLVSGTSPLIHPILAFRSLKATFKSGNSLFGEESYAVYAVFHDANEFAKANNFTKEEKKAWKEIAIMLENYGLLTIANAISMELLATAWVQYIACCQKMLESNEIIVNGPDGGSMYNPHFNAQHKLGQLVSRYSQDLGLSSQSLAKIGSLMLKKKKEKDEFFND